MKRKIIKIRKSIKKRRSRRRKKGRRCREVEQEEEAWEDESMKTRGGRGPAGWTIGSRHSDDSSDVPD